MWLPDLADPAWVRRVLSQESERLGFGDGPCEVALLDVRLSHPHRPESRLCHGWATYVVTPRGAPPVQLYLKGFTDVRDSPAAPQEHRGDRGPGHAHHLHEHGLVVWRFPDDPGLPTLRHLAGPTVAPSLLPSAVTEVLPSGADGAQATVVRYQPEASATLRVSSAGHPEPAVFAKHLAGGAVAQVAARHRALWELSRSATALRVTEPLAADPLRNVLWTREVPGGPLVEMVATAALPDEAPAIGRLLAVLHLSGAGPAETVDVDLLVAELRKKAAKISAAHPDVARLTTDLVSVAAENRSAMQQPRRCALHGDLHLDQLVSSPDGPVLVDLDSMLSGPPEFDLAELLVDLALRRLPPPVTRAVADRLLSSYTAAADATVDPALLELCAAAEFVNRCYRHLRRHTAGWQRALEVDLARRDDVFALLTGGPALRSR